MINFFKGLGLFVLLIILLLIVLIALVMPENFNQHILQVTALVGTLSALVSVVWTQYNKSREEDNKQRQFELEKKYQISKETYQKIFDKKIDVYQSLYNEIHKFKKQVYEIGKYFDDVDGYGNLTIEQLTIENVNVSALLRIFKLIDENHFLISTELMEDYQRIYDLYRKSTQEFEFMNDVGAIDNPKEQWQNIRADFFGQYKKVINDFFNQIENEIKKMKQVIED